MKKVFIFGLAATAMLASCSNDETVEMPQSKAIAFSEAFVNNGTRSIDPSFTTATLEDFAAYGYAGSGLIFDATKVSGTNWTYSPLQYWVAGNKYTFGAIAPAAQSANVSNVALANDMVTMNVAFTNNGTLDLLHAAPAVIDCNEAFLANPQKVAMTFNHQLAKVKFSFENAVGAGYNVKVTDIKITDAKETGKLTVGATNAWSEQAGAIELAFGNVVADDAAADAEAAVIANGAALESNNEMLLIPTDNTAVYTVTFTAELFQGEVSLGTFNHTTKIENVALRLGYCYDFKAVLTHENISEDPLKPIEFAVAGITDWNNADLDQEIPASK